MNPTNDDFDWATLALASGTAEHVPAALRELLSIDPQVRRRAYWRLDNHIVLQGSLYGAAPFAVKVLLQSWPQDDSLKDRMYELLIELANGGAPDDLEVNWGDRRMPLEVATVASLVEGMHHFSHDLGSSLSTVRRQAAELLLALSDYETLGPQELHELQQRESDPGIKALLCELAEAALEIK